MMFTINDFIAHVLANGVQRANRFKVIISLPDKVIEKYSHMVDEIRDENSPSYDTEDQTDLTDNKSSIDVARTLSLMALEVNLPAYSASTVDLPVGSTRKVAYDKSDGELNITFRCSGNMTEKKLFDAWKKQIFKSDHTVAFYDDYIAPQINILTVNMSDNVTYQCAVNEAYPATVSELSLSHEQENTVATFQVTFNYRKLFNTNEDYSNKDIQDKSLDVDNNTTPILPTDPTVSDLPQFQPDTNNLGSAAMYQSIDRVKNQVEQGILSRDMGTKVLKDILNNINNINSGQLGGIPKSQVDKVVNYIGSLTFVLAKK